MRRQLSPLLISRPTALLSPHFLPLSHRQTRPFTLPNLPHLPILNLTPEIQTLVHTRTLPYPASHIFSLITDIPSYPLFLPYCLSTTVHSSSPSSDHPLPTLASINIGFSTYTETLTSRIYSSPPFSIEACTGDAQPTLKYTSPPKGAPSSSSSTSSPAPAPASPSNPGAVPDETSLFSHLLTTWTLKPFPFKPPPSSSTSSSGAISPEKSASNAVHEQTEVRLRIEYALRNPVYAAMAGAVGEGVGAKMVDAFERRAAEVWLARGRAARDHGPTSALEGVSSGGRE